jgi:hypothetical protein
VAARAGGEGLVGALQDALRTDVDPTAGRHLAEHGQAHRLQAAKLFPGRPFGYEQTVGDQHARSHVVRAQHADRLARLHQQRFVVLQLAQRGHDGIEGLPTPRRFSGTAVDDEAIRIFGHFGIEVVHEHAQGGLLPPALAGALRATRSVDGHLGWVHVFSLSPSR